MPADSTSPDARWQMATRILADTRERLINSKPAVAAADEIPKQINSDPYGPVRSGNLVGAARLSGGFRYGVASEVAIDHAPHT